MIVLENFIIDKISVDNAESIHRLMVSNAERFKRFFPKTLEQNLTVELATLFVTAKVEEFTTKKEFLYTIKESKTNQVVGLVYIKELDWDKKQGEFAYCIDSNYEGKGLTSKIVKELSRYAFTNLGLKILQIIVHKTNIGSVKVAKKCGYIWQKILLKAHTPPNEAPLDMELYELYK
jgi:ribosomal-protein-alanine N-acetyltransferase